MFAISFTGINSLLSQFHARGFFEKPPNSARVLENVTPAQAGTQSLVFGREDWMPAFAGMTEMQVSLKHTDSTLPIKTNLSGCQFHPEVFEVYIDHIPPIFERHQIVVHRLAGASDLTLQIGQFRFGRMTLNQHRRR